MNSVSPKKHLMVGAQSNDHSARLVGISSNQFFTDAHTFMRIQSLVTEYYRLDSPSNFWDVYNVEAEALGQKVICYPDGLPDTDRTRPLISKPADLDSLFPPDPYKSGRKVYGRSNYFGQ